MNSPIEILQKIAAPELNFLLTEPPRHDGELGWFCREHAIGTVILAAALGITSKVVQGDFIVRTPGFRVTSIGSTFDHVWCCTGEIRVLDLSLHFRKFGPVRQIAEPIVRLGRNGDFDVRILPPDTEPLAGFGDDSVIGYVPHKIHHETARDWISSPLPFLRNVESAAITMRVVLHVIRVLNAESSPMLGSMTQFHALAHLRQTYEDAIPELQRILGRG